MIHIGQCIREQLEKQGKSTVWLARELGCHRTNLYKIYERPSIDASVLLRISRIMQFDFFRYYSDELKSLSNCSQVSYM